MKLRNMLKITTAVMLASVMIAVSIPHFHVQKAYAQEPEIQELEDPDMILTMESVVPDELNGLSEDDNVYAVDKGQPFLLSEQNELALIAGSGGTGNINEVDIFDTFDLEMTSRDSDGNCWVNGINSGYAGNSYKLGNYPYSGIWDIQSIGLDADGTGRKQYIASVGISKSEKAIMLIVQNAVDGSFKKIRIGEASSATQVWSAYEFVIDNYMAITAGDYDGDGIDSIIVYVCANGDNVRLMEYTVGTNGEWYGSDILNLSDMLVENRFKTVSNFKYKPSVSLATGDFTGDGRDQLAFSAGFYNTSDDVRDGYMDYDCSDMGQFATCVAIGDRTGLGGWLFSDPIWMYDLSSDYTSSGSFRTYPVTIMHGGAIAAGDVNNDGIDEIVAAGYVSLTKDESSSNFARAVYTGGSLTSVSHICDFSKNLLVSSVISRSGNNYVRSPLKTFSMNASQAYSHRNYCNDKDWVFTKLSIACARTNGNNNREDVFIAGCVYDFSESLPTVVIQPAFMDSDNDTLPDILGAMGFDTNSSVNFVRRVSVGNFNGNDAGREQFVFTFWQKSKDINSYTSTIGVITGVEYGDQLDKDGNVTSYGAPEFYGSSLKGSDYHSLFTSSFFDNNTFSKYQLLIHSRVNTDYDINATPVAVDVDDDGVVGRFSRSGYIYTDPDVLAVLEAGPYFEEINEAGGYEDPCQTSYSISTGFGTGTSREDKMSLEVGIAAEASGGPVKVSLEAGYSMDWSHSFEQTFTKTYTSTFRAQSEDQVIIYRVPQLIYTYDILKKETDNDTGEEIYRWVENGMNVRVPLMPVYFSLGIDEYNEFVDEYNDIVGVDSNDALNKIIMGTDLPDDHIGNPDRYWKDWPSAGDGYMKLSNSNYNLDYSSGNKECVYSEEGTQTESQSVSHGFHFGLTVQGGGNFVVGEAWAGGYYNMDFSTSTGNSTTTVNITESGGQVQNIKAKAVEGLSESQVKSGYGFKWSFGKWTRRLSSGGAPVPFYGYVVFNVNRRALPPELENRTESVAVGYSAFSISEPTGSLSSELTVTKVSGNSKITYDKSSKSIKVAAGLAKGSYPAVFRISNGLTARDRTFTLTIKVSDSNISIEGAEVILSSAGLPYNGKAQKPTIRTINGQALKEGTDYTASWSDPSSKDVGVYSVAIKGKGRYTGNTYASYRICFSDVPLSHNYQKAVYWATDNGIAAGYTGSKLGRFGIGDEITRAQVVMFLWRAAGQPRAKDLKTQSFTDVPVTSNFYKAIQWAVEQGITGGYTGEREGQFGPSDSCTRGQIAMFLWRYAGKPDPESNTKTFSDVPLKHNFFKAVQWAAEQGITAGYSDGSFGVSRSCTRGHCVTFLYRMLGE